MSERPTPETDAETMRDEYDHVDSDIGPFAPSNTVCADFARKLERERDEAREALKHIEEYGTEEINAAVELRQKLATALVERDETREKAERYRIEANAMMMQRDEWAAMCGRYKQERDIAEQDVTNYHARIIELIDERDKTKRERDEARDVLEEISLYLSSGIGDENTTAQQYKERILDGVKHLAGHAWEERCKFERERDEAREVLREIAEASGFDNIGNWARNKARKALEGAK